MTSYTRTQWERYQVSRNPEFLWRIASFYNLLTPEEERTTEGRELSVVRQAELECLIQQLPDL